MSVIIISSKVCVDPMLIVFAIIIPQNMHAIVIPTPIPSDGQWMISLDGFLSSTFDPVSNELDFGSDSMIDVKSDMDLGLYGILKI